jgi:hypothetical protein
MADQGMVPPEAAAEAPVEGGDELTQLISNLSDGMSMLLEVASSAGLDASKLDAAQQAYQAAVEDVLAGGGKPGMAPAGQGMASPEAGAMAGAVPATPAGIKRG